MGQPFRDRARAIRAHTSLKKMETGCNHARSTTWWRRLTEQGPWDGERGGEKITPPDPDSIEGIAKLYGLTPEEVTRMVVEDWYGVPFGPGGSQRACEIADDLEKLDPVDYDMIRNAVDSLVRQRMDEKAAG